MSVEYPAEFDENRREMTEAEEAQIRRTILLKRVVIFLAAAVVLLCVAVSAITILTVRMAQVGNTDTLESAQQAAEAARRGTKRIQDCTTPGRPCYDQALRQQAAAIGSINKVAIIAASCASGNIPIPVDVIAECVAEGLRKDSAKHAEKAAAN